MTQLLGALVALAAFAAEIKLEPAHIVQVPRSRGASIHAEFSPDGKLLAISVPGKKGARNALGAATSIAARDQVVDGSQQPLVSNFDSDGIVLWDIEARSQQGFLPTGHRNGVVSQIHFLGEGKRVLALVSESNGIYCWDAKQHSLVYEQHDEDHYFRGIDVAADEKTIATIKTGDRPGVHLHDAATGDFQAYLGNKRTDDVVVYRPGTAQFSTAMNLWTPGDPAKVESPQRYTSVDAVAYSPDGMTLYGLDWGSTRFYVWNLQTKELSLPFQEAFRRTCPRGLTDFAIDLSGRLLATTERGGDRVLVWDLKSRTLLAVGNGHAESPQFVSFSPNGKQFVSTDNSGGVIVWDIGKLVGDE